MSIEEKHLKRQIDKNIVQELQIKIKEKIQVNQQAIGKDNIKFNDQHQQKKKQFVYHSQQQQITSSLQEALTIKYLHSIRNNKKNKEEDKKVVNYFDKITTNINKDLQNGTLQIIKRQRPFQLQQKRVKQQSQQQQMRIKLQEKKQEAIQKIRLIEKQEIMLKKNIISSSDKLHRSKIKRNSSLVIKPPPQTEQQQFKRAILNHRNFLKEIQKRNSIADQQHQKIALMQIKQHQQSLRIRRQSKKLQVIQNLKSIVSRQKARNKMIEEWKQKQKQLKQSKYLYIQNSIKEKELMESKINQKNNFLQKLRNSHLFNKSQIEDHQKKINQMLQIRKNSIFQSKISQVSERVKYNQTKFTQIVKKQLQDLKNREMQKFSKVKQRNKKQKLDKIEKYINQQIKPKIHLKQFIQQQRSQSLEALSAEGLRNQGLKNLQKAKKLKKSQSELKFFKLKKQSQQKLRIAKTKDVYKDYLQQIKKDIKYDPTQKQLKLLLQKNRKRTQSDFESISKARYLSEYAVQKTPVFGDQKAYLAIQKKLQLLQAIY